jgi:hypothetical protein
MAGVCYGLWMLPSISMEPFRAFVGDAVFLNNEPEDLPCKAFLLARAPLLLLYALDF